MLPLQSILVGLQVLCVAVLFADCLDTRTRRMGLFVGLRLVFCIYTKRVSSSPLRSCTPLFGSEMTRGCLRKTNEHFIMKRTNSPTLCQPNQRKIGLTVAFGPLFPTANKFWHYIASRLRTINLTQILREHHHLGSRCLITQSHLIRVARTNTVLKRADLLSITFAIRYSI